MAETSSEINIAGTGHVYVAPVATAAPADTSTAFSGTWKELGYTNESGVVFHIGVTHVDIKAWQSFYPVRRLITERDATLKFTLLQMNTVNLKLAFGGGTVSTGFSPALEGTVDTRALAVEWTDGAVINRIIVPQGQVTDTDDINLTKAGATDLGITFSVNGTDGAAPWYLLSNSSALVS
jgi:hypothetical protein